MLILRYIDAEYKTHYISPFVSRELAEDYVHLYYGEYEVVDYHDVPRGLALAITLRDTFTLIPAHNPDEGAAG